MSYVRYDINDGVTVLEWPYTYEKLRKDNPNTSFPREIMQSVLDAYGLAPVTVLSKPVYDEATQRVQLQSTPLKDVDQLWYIGWDIIALTPEQITNRALSTASRNFVNNVDAERASILGLEDDRLRDVIGIIYTEAKAFQANSQVTTPGIQTIADTWGVTRGQAMQRVINKYGSYISNICERFAIREDAIDPPP